MSDDDKIGYGNPPKHSQFKPGESGNSKGRPKGAKNLKTDLDEELRELIDLNEGGVRKRVSKRRAMLKSVTAKAVQGDTRAAAIVIDMIYRLLHEDEPEKTEQGLLEDDLEILQTYEKRLRQSEARPEASPDPSQGSPELHDDGDDGADGQDT